MSRRLRWRVCLSIGRSRRMHPNDELTTQESIWLEKSPEEAAIIGDFSSAS